MVKELLKESEIKVNQAQTTDGRTALYIASIKGFLEVVQVFLVHPGINVNQARTNYGDTPHIPRRTCGSCEGPSSTT